ncbi:MAG: PEP-CTERM sorting domain-containing protein [Colwellia sp.]|nr:PEP-CTERM sorting domain-containing protein [Colwellia sp.]
MKLIIRSLILVGVFLSLSANAGLLVNGDFDVVDHSQSAEIYDAYAQPYLDELDENTFNNWGLFTSIPGWTTLPLMGDSYVEVLHTGANTGGVEAHSGGLFVELDLDVGGATYNSAIGQTLNDLIEGMFYELSFYYQPRTDADDDNGINAYWFEGDLSGFDLMQNIVITADSNTNEWVNVVGTDDDGWKQYTGVFEATSSTMTFAFSGFGTVNGNGGFIDTASVTQVPEPSVFALMLMGLFGLVVRKVK